MSGNAQKEKYEQEHDALLSKWTELSHVGDGVRAFFWDGVICPDEWFGDNRPLFLLKEAYEEENTKAFHDLRKWMDGTIWTGDMDKRQFIVFKKILQWTSILIGETDASETLEMLKDRYKWNDSLFKRIAFINIKKYNGESRTSALDIWRHVKVHGAQLRKQIELADPTVIVCGGTMRWLLAILEINPGIKRGKNKNPYYVYESKINDHPLYIIDYWHPAYFGKEEQVFCDGITNALREIERMKSLNKKK